MAAIPLDRFHGWKDKGKEPTNRPAYSTSSSLMNLPTGPVASSSNSFPSTSSRKARIDRHASPSPARSRSRQDGLVVEVAEAVSENRVIGRARSEVDIRSRTRRPVETPSASSLTTTASSSTPTTSPTATRASRPPAAGPSTPSTFSASPSNRTDFVDSPASFVTARSIPIRTPPPRPTRSPHRDVSSPCPPPVPVGTTRPRSCSNRLPDSTNPPKTTLIHGTEFEIVSAVTAPPLPPPLPQAGPKATEPMSTFVFPPPLDTHTTRSPHLQLEPSRSTASDTPLSINRSRPSPFSSRPPPSVSSSFRSPHQHHHAQGSSESVFRLDRPHALPESFLAFRRQSLTQGQLDDFARGLVDRISPPSSRSDSTSSSREMSGEVGRSPVSKRGRERTKSGGAAGGESEDWARQRRMSSLLSGLGMVLGSTSFGAGSLLMETEEEEETVEAEASSGYARSSMENDGGRHLGTPASQSGRPSFEGGLSPARMEQMRRASVMTAYESAEEDFDWTSHPTPRSRDNSAQEPTSFATSSSSPPQLDFDPLAFTPLSSGSIPMPISDSKSSNSIVSQRTRADVAVAFGYACGGNSDTGSGDEGGDPEPRRMSVDDNEEADPSSIKQLVRRSWRLSSSSAGSRDFKPLSPKRQSVRLGERLDDGGLGITLEELDFGSVVVSTGGTQSSYTPSSRPVMPRAPSISLLSEVTTAPLSPQPSSTLPTSPPLIAEPPTPTLTTTPALSSSRTMSPHHSLPPTPEPTPGSSETQKGARHSALSPPTRSTPDPASLSSPQPRTSSLSPSTESVLLRRRSSTEEGFLTRRRSALGASKSSRRISALFSSGMDKVRSRTSSHNSKDGDDEREVEDGRVARRRALTDGLISGPISTPSLRPSPSVAHLPSKAIRSDLAPPPPPNSTPLTQSPFQGRTWRSTLIPGHFEDLTHELGVMEMRRQEVIWELCETERSFVNGLRGVIQVFTLPLRTRNGTWIKGVPVPVSRLLDWLDDIVYLHSQISAALELARSGQHPIVNKIAEAFLPFVARLEVHQPYLVRFETVTRAIDDMTADPTSDFGEFVRMQSSLPECGSLSLSSFLLKPVQRLMKYPLFFRQLCDLTSPNHPDHLNTLSLLHSTDSIIRVMQEVKTREDEYQEAKVLESRISGLPTSFRLACRDRRLVAHGVLKRVHINDKDRSLLEMDAVARAGKSAPTLRGSAPISPGLSPVIDHARPKSTVSDSSSSSLSAGSLTYASDTSNGWNSPTTPGAFQSPRTFDFGSSTSPLPSPLLRPDSMISNSSSIYSDDSYKGSSAAATSAFGSRRGGPPSTTRRVVKTKAKESTVYAFVFSDLIVLATKAATASTFIKAKAGSKRSEQTATYRALESIGVSRVLGVSDLTGKTEHDHLIEVDLLPIREGQEHSPLSLSNTSFASSIYLTLPPPSSSRSPLPPSASTDSQFKERIRWLQAFERSYLFALRSLSFPSTALSSFPSSSTTPMNLADSCVPPLERLSCASYLDAGIVPKSPSQQLLDEIASRDAKTTGRAGGGDDGQGTLRDGAQLEREERGWWAVRLKKVRKEMEGELWDGPGGTFMKTGSHSTSRPGGGQSTSTTRRKKEDSTREFMSASASSSTGWSVPSSKAASSYSARHGGGGGGTRVGGQMASFGVGQVVPRGI